MTSADSPLHQLAKLPPPDHISRKPKKDIWTSLNNLRRRDLVNFAKYTPQSMCGNIYYQDNSVIFMGNIT